MATIGHEMISALQRRDATSFGEASQRLRESVVERAPTVEQLLNIVRRGQPNEALLALNALRFSGLILEGDAFEGLVQAAKDLFPPTKLRDLAIEERSRERKKVKKSPDILRLLESILMGLLRNGGESGAPFLELVERKFAGTRLAIRVSKWRASSDP